MKCLFTILITLFFLFSCISLSAQQQKKKTIAVLNFVNSGGIEKDEISILTDRFSSFLVNANVYKVLEREKMDAILKEQDFSMSDNCNSSECAVQVGQLLGVDLMVAGKIGKFGTMYALDIRIIDVSTGEILTTKSENYEGKKEGLLGLIEELAYTLSGKSAPKKTTIKTVEKKDTSLPAWPIKTSAGIFVLSTGIGVYSLLQSNSAYDKFKKSTTFPEMNKYEDRTEKYEKYVIYSAITAGSAAAFYFIYRNIYKKSLSTNISVNYKNNQTFELAISKSF